MSQEIFKRLCYFSRTEYLSDQLNPEAFLNFLSNSIKREVSLVNRTNGEISFSNDHLRDWSWKYLSFGIKQFGLASEGRIKIFESEGKYFLQIALNLNRQFFTLFVFAIFSSTMFLLAPFPGSSFLSLIVIPMCSLSYWITVKMMVDSLGSYVKEAFYFYHHSFRSEEDFPIMKGAEDENEYRFHFFEASHKIFRQSCPVCGKA